MKIRALIILSSALILLSAFFFVCGLCLAEKQATNFITQPATINKVVGEVEYYSKDSGLWQKAAPKIQLSEGDKIKTAIGAKAELILEDGSFIRLKENSTVHIIKARKKIDTNATQYELDLRVGEIMLELQELSKGSEFKVRTPTAVAATRGTTYYVRTGSAVINGEEKKFVEIYVDEGTVEYENILSGESCIVPEGLGAIVYDDGTIDGPYPIPPDKQGAWKSGWEMVKVDDGAKKGMRDADEEGDDTGEDDVDDLNDSQEDSQDGANNEQTNEQDLYGLAKVDVITDQDEEGGEGEGFLDSDGDGIPNDLDPDDDNDGYSDKDEEDNETDPLVAPSVPPDNDKDFVSDLNDPDDDNDLVWDIVETNNETDPLSTDPLNVDTDDDSYNDFEDAFPKDDIVDIDTENSAGYGSWAELRQAALDNLTIQDLNGDISSMIDDIHCRGYEAAKDKIFDYQAGKVMKDIWGNRVRVEEYVSRPTDDQVQILALNLRTGGPNAGISSLDFRVTFDQDITNTNLKGLPWGNYMYNPQVDDFVWAGGKPGDDDDQLILYVEENPGYYNPQDSGYPLPLEFSMQVKNPYSDWIKFTESYFDQNSENGNLYLHQGSIKGRGEEGQFSDCWYQIEESSMVEIKGQNGVKQFSDNDRFIPPNENGQGDLWNQLFDGSANMHAFLDLYGDDPSDLTWLLGVFYLIDDNGAPVPIEEVRGEGLLDFNGIRDCINPEHNLEMIFLSSEFILESANNSSFTTRDTNNEELTPEERVYNLYDDPFVRTIDVISIPEITEPYYTPDAEEPY